MALKGFHDRTVLKLAPMFERSVGADGTRQAEFVGWRAWCQVPDGADAVPDWDERGKPFAEEHAASPHAAMSNLLERCGADGKFVELGERLASAPPKPLTCQACGAELERFKWYRFNWGGEMYLVCETCMAKYAPHHTRELEREHMALSAAILRKERERG